MIDPTDATPPSVYISVGGEHYLVQQPGTVEDVTASIDEAMRQGSNLHLTVSLDLPGAGVPRSPVLILNGAQLAAVAVWDEISPAGHPGMGLLP